jgi:DNA-binding transcriptional ArsR family regulator
MAERRYGAKVTVDQRRYGDEIMKKTTDPPSGEVLPWLWRGEASIGALASLFGTTIAGTEKHVQVLESAGLVTGRKIGRVGTGRVGRLEGFASEPRGVDRERDIVRDGHPTGSDQPRRPRLR